MTKHTFCTLLSLLFISLCCFGQSRVGQRHFEICPHQPKFGFEKLNAKPSFMHRSTPDCVVVGRDTLKVHVVSRGQRLKENDYVEVANELKVEVAAIKAVVEIETGKIHCGFNRDLTPIINFNTAVFRTMAGRHNINLDNYRHTHPLVFEAPDSSLYQDFQRAHYQRLHSAMSIDAAAAVEGAFWGMFQIGGFNWRKCGVKSVAEFAEIMSGTERDQLDLFANFLKSTGLLRHLQQKDWRTFARLYNGPSYENYNYHTRLEAAYNKYSKK